MYVSKASDGMLVGYQESGDIVMTMIVVVANALILSSSYQISVGISVLVFLSILIYFVALNLITNIFVTFENFGSAK